MSTASKLLAGLGAATGVGYGVYYMSQMKDISALEKDRADIVALIVSASGCN